MKTLSVLALILFSLFTHGKPLGVCPSCELNSIKRAVQNAVSGDRIEVQPGTYFETGILVDKSLELVAKGTVIVDGGNGGDHIFIFTAPQIKIKGFTIKNTGSSYLKELSGIRVIKTDDCEISKNHFENTTYGIYLENSKKCRIRNNIFRGRAVDEVSGGNGIHLWQGEEVVIENNDIQGHRDGIYFEFVKRAQVNDNFVSKNIRYGLHFMSSNECNYQKNIFLKNGAGVAVMYSRKISMTHNRFYTNSGVAAYGLLLKEIHDGTIGANIFEENTVGIFMEGSNRNKFEKNIFKFNGWGIRIMGDCEDNTFTHNDLVENTFDVATNSEQNPNHFSHNFWSQYSGYDLNKDGVGDIPYRPVKLSSVIVENVDSSFILIKSFLMILLDEIERSLPELIPEKMKDESPMMKPQAGDQ